MLHTLTHIHIYRVYSHTTANKSDWEKSRQTEGKWEKKQWKCWSCLKLILNRCFTTKVLPLTIIMTYRNGKLCSALHYKLLYTHTHTHTHFSIFLPPFYGKHRWLVRCVTLLGSFQLVSVFPPNSWLAFHSYRFLHLNFIVRNHLVALNIHQINGIQTVKISLNFHN